MIQQNPQEVQPSPGDQAQEVAEILRRLQAEKDDCTDLFDIEPGQFNGAGELVEGAIEARRMGGAGKTRLYLRETLSDYPNIREALESTGTDVGFSVDEFLSNLVGLEADDFTDRAFELVEDFSTLPASDVARVHLALQKGGMKARDRTAWKKGVNDLRKERQAQAPKPANPAKDIIVRYGLRFMERESFARDGGNKLYWYDGGVYRDKGARRISHLLEAELDQENLTEHFSRYRVDEIVAFIRDRCPVLWDEIPIEHSSVVNVANGLLDLHTGEIQQHTPLFYSTVQYPIEFNADATAPKWDALCKTLFPEDIYSSGVHWQLACWALMSDNPAQQALMLTGPGGNGKSRFLKALESLVGRENTAHLALHTLANNRFAVPVLLNKALNYCADLSSRQLADTSLFKALTGDDTVGGEYKGGRFFSFRNRAKLAFSANEIPGAPEANDAFFRRWMIIEMTWRAPKGKGRRAADIDAELATPGELSGVLNEVIKVAPAVLQRGVGETETMARGREKFIAAVDPFALFARNHIVPDKLGKITRADLMNSYGAFCTERKIRKLGADEISKRLLRRFPEATLAHISTPGRAEPVAGFNGVRLLNSDT